MGWGRTASNSLGRTETSKETRPFKRSARALQAIRSRARIRPSRILQKRALQTKTPRQDAVEAQCWLFSKQPFAEHKPRPERKKPATRRSPAFSLTMLFSTPSFAETNAALSWAAVRQSSPARGRPLSQPGDFASSESLGAQTFHLGRNLSFPSSRRGLPDFVCSLHQLPDGATLTELMFCSGSNDLS